MTQDELNDLYAAAVAVEVRDVAVGRVLVALVRSHASLHGLDVEPTTHEGADVASYVQQQPEVLEDTAQAPGKVQEVAQKEAGPGSADAAVSPEPEPTASTPAEAAPAETPAIVSEAATPVEEAPHNAI